MYYFLAQATPIVTAVTNINWTLIISVTAVSLTAMTAAISIFKSKKTINDDELRESNLIQDLTGKVRENKDKSDSIKDVIAELKTEIAKIKIELLNTNKSHEELRKDNRELVQRLDDLLKQLLELLGS